MLLTCKSCFQYIQVMTKYNILEDGQPFSVKYVHHFVIYNDWETVAAL